MVVVLIIFYYNNKLDMFAAVPILEFYIIQIVN